jgi:hypothetical protein
MLKIEDRIAIYECIATHGHLIDDGRLDELDLVFSEDVVYDLTAFDLGVHSGLESVKKAALELGENNPIGHHVTNSIISRIENETVYTVSKGMGVNSNGTTGSVVYRDRLVKKEDGWRICYRKIIIHDSPLSGVYNIA